MELDYRIIGALHFHPSLLAFLLETMNTVRALSDLSTCAILKYLATCERPWEPSELYATATSENITDSGIRKSESQTIVDPALFSLCESLVRDISASDSTYDYTLVPDNLTHIRYFQGGFFSRHVDHCRGTSNVIKEFTLCINVNQDGTECSGGHTVIHAPADADGSTSPTVFESTTKRGGGLIFRKDVEHEGLHVETGEKKLLCLNLWGRRKKSGQVCLVVTSADSLSAAPSSAAPSSAAASAAVDVAAGAATLRQASTDRTHFALAAEDAASSHVLKLVLEEANRHAAENDSAPQAVESLCFVTCRTISIALPPQSHWDFFLDASLTRFEEEDDLLFDTRQADGAPAQSRRPHAAT